MKWMLLPAALAAGLLVAADAKDDAAKKDMDALQGKWTVVSMESDGGTLTLAKDAVRVIKGDKYTVTLTPDLTIEGTFKIDPTAKPRRIDTKATSGPYKDQELQGIYEIDGDTLKICYGLPGKDRPTEFKGKDGCMLMVHKKAKD